MAVTFALPSWVPTRRRSIASSSRPAQPRGGRFIERVGTFDPLRSELRVEGARVKHWLDRGAQPSATVSVLFKNAKVTGADAAATPAAAPTAATAGKKKA